MREVTTLQNSLPVEHGAGIWIRVDEDKPHVMKALISGPMDTPYAQGLFEFDILLPANYPNSPPKVRWDMDRF
jgi:ubiquitin-protein ligase